MEERTFFNEGAVLVTNSRFAVGGQTYAMANVTSVKTAQSSIVGAVVMILLGIMLLIAQAWAGAVPCLLIGGLLLYFRKTYLVLHTAGAEQRALESTDSKYIDKVRLAVNEAIVHRG